MARHAIRDITVQHGASGVVVLHPSLRAAYRLEIRHGGFHRLASLVLDGSITVIRDIVQEAAPDDCQDILDAIDHEPIGRTLDALRSPLIEYIAALAGITPGDKPEPTKPNSKATPFDWCAHHEKLFELATGQIGWTPDAAWSATPSEIIAALNGRQEMFRSILAAVFGTPEEDEQPRPYTEPVFDEHGMDPAFDRAGLQALKAKFGP